MTQKRSDRMLRFLTGDRRTRMVVALGLAGMLLVLLGSLLDDGGTASPDDGQTLTVQQYIEDTEHRLEAMLSAVDGVGKARVMVTLENGVETVYAKDEKQSIDKTTGYEGEAASRVQEKESLEQSYILVDSSAGRRQALTLTQLEPVIKGVVVVCPGANSAVIQERVIDAVTTALQIRSIQVCVVPSAK